MWGKLFRQSHFVLIARVIPTGVGKARPLISAALLYSGHPHGCGESEDTHTGQSAPSRVIPTGVGKAACWYSAQHLSSGHPHGCGESVRRRSSSRWDFGSSPRVWGKREGFGFRLSWRRVIPTGVGKASPGQRNQPAAAGHPHGCGESVVMPRNNTPPSGSSPRVWGKHSERCGQGSGAGVIPTGVGKAGY